MYRTTLFCASALCLSTLVGCSSFYSYATSEDTEAPSDPASMSSPMPPQPSGGLLTAGDWDDNLNFALFQEYLSRPPFQAPAYQVADRIVITVRSPAGGPLANARVSVSSGSRLLLSAPTGSDGRILFFPSTDGGAGTAGSALTLQVAPPVEQAGVAALTMPLAIDKTDVQITLPDAQSRLPQSLDLAFVVDTTGSMGDELGYLQAELSGIAQQVRAEFPAVDQRYALVVYRDRGDEYVTRSFNFTTDLASFQRNLDGQNAGGGGDTPEAMEEGMAVMNQLAWRSGNVARLAFLVADAPTHAADAGTFLSQGQTARQSGIRMYPVAASGVDVQAEYLMRISAQLTLGRYIFLSNDSGIGDSHMEPHIPCYQVSTLNKVILRSIRSELAGARQPVDPKDVIRSAGNPMNGVCTLANGSKAYL